LCPFVPIRSPRHTPAGALLTAALDVSSSVFSCGRCRRSGRRVAHSNSTRSTSIARSSARVHSSESPKHTCSWRLCPAGYPELRGSAGRAIQSEWRVPRLPSFGSGSGSSQRSATQPLPSSPLQQPHSRRYNINADGGVWSAATGQEGARSRSFSHRLAPRALASADELPALAAQTLTRERGKARP